jgi:malate synthase
MRRRMEIASRFSEAEVHMHIAHAPDTIRIIAPPTGADDLVLTHGAVAFVAELTRAFRSRIEHLLHRRHARQIRFDAGERPSFLPETYEIRVSEWRVASVPADLRDRRVEITGPVDRKMVINGLNSRARVFVADFEDATSPTWSNLIEGQRNLQEAVRGTIRDEAPERGEIYELRPPVATLMVRPRGLHLPETHVLVDGRPAPGALVDFGLSFFHNARALIEKGSGPYYSVPKLESHLEARLWNDVFLWAQEAVGLPRGTIRATVLIETLPAAFEMDEILYELREHSAGLTCGRWDYIFSVIKNRRADPACLLPDRRQVTMDGGFLRAYARLLIDTCHRRGAHAIGGLAVHVPNRNDTHANEAAVASVRADTLREALDGHDGTSVAHPALVPVAQEIFDRHMPGANQIHVWKPRCRVGARELLSIPEGTRTTAGLRLNVCVGIRYLAAWIGGTGRVALDNLMEDAATAEIARAQVWQWIRHGATLDDGTHVTPELVRRLIDEEIERIRIETGDVQYRAGWYGIARDLFENLCFADQCPEFLTLAAYALLKKGNGHACC